MTVNFSLNLRKNCFFPKDFSKQNPEKKQQEKRPRPLKKDEELPKEKTIEKKEKDEKKTSKKAEKPIISKVLPENFGENPNKISILSNLIKYEKISSKKLKTDVFSDFLDFSFEFSLKKFIEELYTL